jgi:hypothetical protein
LKSKKASPKTPKRGGKIGRNSQLGIEPDDAQPLKPKLMPSRRVVAKKAGVSTRTLERGKKYLRKPVK